jgi:hypothetical protein
MTLERRPRTRAECVSGPRPCPFVSCRHHLYLEVDQRNGAIKLNHPDKEPGELEHSCALDVADSEQDGRTLDQISKAINVTRERVRQIELNILTKLERQRALEEFIGDGREPGPWDMVG